MRKENQKQAAESGAVPSGSDASVRVAIQIARQVKTYRDMARKESLYLLTYLLDMAVSEAEDFVGAHAGPDLELELEAAQHQPCAKTEPGASL